MKKNDLREKMQSGFLEAAPDVYEAVLKTTEKNKLMLQEGKLHEVNESVTGSIVKDFSRKQSDSCKSNMFWGKISKYALSACAGLALFFLYLFGMSGNNQDDICIVMDINPSVQIVMNESCQIKKLQGLNQDGKNIIQTLDWKREDSLLRIVDVLLQSTVEEAYLHKGSGILVTISAKDRDIYDKLEGEIGTGVDKKLEEMGISDVTTAFQRVGSGSKKAGRELLEVELAEKYGADEDELRQMSVIELIQYCRKHAAEKLEFSPVSEKQWQEDFKKGNSGQKEKEKPESAKSKEKAGTDKSKTDSNDKVEDKQLEKGENESTEKDAPSQGNQQNSGSGSGIKHQNPTSASSPEQAQPSVTQPESPLEPQPEGAVPIENPPQNENREEDDSSSEDGKHNNGKPNENSGKDNNNKDNNNKDNNNKDNNNKDNNNKDNNNKDNNNKDNNNKDNNNKDNNNKDNNNKDNNNKDNNNKDNNNKDNNNKDNSNKDNNNKDKNNKDKNNKDNSNKNNNK